MSVETKKKATRNAIAITILVIMLVITTLALILSFVKVDKNDFETGTVKIGLNEGKVIFDGSDNNIEPNKTLVKNFTIENRGTADAHYRLYLENVNGPLQESLNFKIYDGEELLYNGSAKNLTKESPCMSNNILTIGENRKMTAVVNMDKDSGNEYQNGTMMFDITVDAVQSKNNPDKEFN